MQGQLTTHHPHVNPRQKEENVVIMKLVVSQKTVGAKSLVQKEAQGCWPYQKIESSQEELLSLQNPIYLLFAQQ